MAMSDADQELMELQRSAATQGHAAGLPSGPAAADPNTITTFQARRAAQNEAWGQFVANGPIYIGNALAFHAGSQVPLEHVIKYQLEEQELVNRVATPEMARVGKTFATDDEYYAANPHIGRRTVAAPELHPSALDPRGGAAHLDVKGVHGPKLTGTEEPPGQPDPESESHRARAGAVAAAAVKQGADDDKAGAKAPAKSTGSAAGKDKD
jgi:hypothetical protein